MWALQCITVLHYVNITAHCSIKLCVHYSALQYYTMWTLQCITLHCANITVHYTNTLGEHYSALYFTVKLCNMMSHWITVQSTLLHYGTLHYSASVTFLTLQCITLHYITIGSIDLYYTTAHNIAFFHILLNYDALQSLYCIVFALHLFSLKP